MFDSPPASTSNEPALSLSNGANRFFLDPWASEYGSALEAEFDEDPASEGPPPDTGVETEEWRPLSPRPVPAPRRIVFVDGVQRIDAFGRILAGDRLVEAALASVAVGAVIWREDFADIPDEPEIERVLAVTESASASALEVVAGNARLVYLPKSHKERGANGIRLAIKERRSELERRYAEQLFAEDALTVLDGRLSFDPGNARAIVGLIKTIQRFYVDAGKVEVIARLAPGQRTPVFRIHYGDTSRYSWFLRLPNTQAIHHPFAGIVRLETPEIGVSAAIALADLTSFHLPAFASRPEHDPRAPQNLAPIGGLEQRLRHELGDALFVRRAIEDMLYEAVS